MSVAPLTQREVDRLPHGSRVRITWSGGNGPHEYEIHVKDGLRYAKSHGIIQAKDGALDFIGSEAPYTVVELLSTPLPQFRARKRAGVLTLILLLAAPVWAHEETATFQRGDCRVELAHTPEGTRATIGAGCDPEIQTCPEPEPCPELEPCPECAVCEECPACPDPPVARGLLQPAQLAPRDSPGSVALLASPPAVPRRIWPKVVGGIVAGLALGYLVGRNNGDEERLTETVETVIVYECRGRCD